MADWRQRLARVAANLEGEFDQLRHRIETRLGAWDSLKIVPYWGYGTADEVNLKGRVLESRGVESAVESDTVWLNLVNMYRRFSSDEVPGAVVEARSAGRSFQVTADEEGYFDLWLPTPETREAGQRWHEVELRLLEPATDEGEVTATGRVLIPSAHARFGVISDIDDTIVRTNATSLLKMARVVFLGNARTRLPFPGVASFYRALQGGVSGADRNPLFYVSSSPWNLFDLLVDFIELQRIPAGPLMLRDWGLSETEILPTGHADHKLTSIRQILDLYPDLPFILVGDSGQEDPEIYAEIVHHYPGRIQAVYIRNVSLDHVSRPDTVRELAAEVASKGSELLLVDDTLAAARHASRRGWIDGSFLEAVAADSVKDKAPTTDDLDIVDEEAQAAGKPSAADLIGQDPRGE